jgi:hypothetical protein
MRQEVQQHTPELFDAVSKILFEQDIVAITCCGEDDNMDDKYDFEAGTVLINWLECKSKEQAQDLIFNVFVRWFGIHIASEHIDRYAKVAALIWELWKEHESQVDFQTNFERGCSCHEKGCMPLAF